MGPKVLLLETISQEAHTLLQQQCEVIGPEFPHGSEGYSDVKAIITRGKGNVDPSLIEKCKSLQAIARCGVGLDNIDVVLASKLDIPVLNTPGMNADTVAEHTIALILMLVRHMSQSISEVQKGNWQFRKSYGGDEVRGKKLGILGFGSIGKKVAVIACALGMEILVLDRHHSPDGFKKCTFHELLKEADIISLHLPLTKSTRNLIGEKELAMMKKTSVLINTARGLIIDHSALKKSLIRKEIAGFGADVLDLEPPVDLDMLQLDNVHVTPHSASLTRTTYNQICLQAVENVLKVLTNQSIEKRFVFNADDLSSSCTIQMV